MDQSDCKLPFTTDILSKCLDDRTIALWDKLKQAKDIRDANLEGLEDCPFCDYALIIPFTVKQLPLFNCTKCKNVSCRICKKRVWAFYICIPDHSISLCGRRIM
jgi:E3 ubiquitin-protein ligase RNF216